MPRENLVIHPRAIKGLDTYRYKSRYGYIVIGAKDRDEAMREAARSTDAPEPLNLEVWDGQKYAPAFPEEFKAAELDLLRAECETSRLTQLIDIIARERRSRDPDRIRVALKVANDRAEHP